MDSLKTIEFIKGRYIKLHLNINKTVLFILISEVKSLHFVTYLKNISSLDQIKARLNSDAGVDTHIFDSIEELNCSTDEYYRVPRQMCASSI